MIKFARFCAAVAVGCIVAQASTHAAPVLVNGGFETGNLNGWSTWSGSPAVTSAQAHSGSFAVAAFGNDAIRQDFAAVASADIGEFSFWVKRSGGPFDSLRLFYGDGSFEDLLVSGNSNDWTHFDVTSQLDAGKTLTGFFIFGTTSGPAYLDDFVLETRAAAVPEPMSLPLVGLALLSLAAVRRARQLGVYASRT